MAALKEGGLSGTQLCFAVPSQPQADNMGDVAAVLSRWHLGVLHFDLGHFSCYGTLGLATS